MVHLLACFFYLVGESTEILANDYVVTGWVHKVPNDKMALYSTWNVGITIRNHTTIVYSKCVPPLLRSICSPVGSVSSVLTVDHCTTGAHMVVGGAGDKERHQNNVEAAQFQRGGKHRHRHSLRHGHVSVSHTAPRLHLWHGACDQDDC
jgi:hypothetical protein